MTPSYTIYRRVVSSLGSVGWAYLFGGTVSQVGRCELLILQFDICVSS